MTEPLTREEITNLKAGQPIRVEICNGTVAEGPAEPHSLRRYGECAVVLGGRRYSGLQHTITTVDNASLALPDRVIVTGEQIVAALHSAGELLGKPHAVAVRDIAIEALGFNPTSGAPAELDGRTPDGWIRQHLDLTKLQRTLDDMATRGIVRKVKSGAQGRPSEDNKLVVFPYRLRTGYVLETDYQEAAGKRADANREAAVAALRAEAVRIVADRHRDEVEAELERLMAELT